MLYILADRILPAYRRNNYYGDYQPVYGKMNNQLHSASIETLHYHSCAEIGICLCGSGITHVDNRIYAFSAGDMQFIPPGVPHFSSAAPNVVTKWHWISLEPLRILKDSGYSGMEQMQKLSEESFAGLFHPWEHPLLADIIHRFRDLVMQDDPYTQLEYVFLSGQLLVECARIGRDRKQEMLNRGYAGKLKPAVQYIREHYPDKEAMREECIAAVCGMSVSHFRAVFKRETGLSVRDFIIQTRLAKAAHMLKNTDASILSVAMESGFGQVSCFNRIFLRTFGQTPTGFRKYAKGG